MCSCVVFFSVSYSFCSPDLFVWLACVAVLMLTYGMAGRGEWCNRSVRGWVELLLDFGADNPGKGNNTHGSINSAFRELRFYTVPVRHRTLKHDTSRPLTSVHVQVLHRLGHLYPHIQAPVTNSQSRGFRSNLSSPVQDWMGAAPWDSGFNLAGFWG